MNFKNFTFLIVLFFSISYSKAQTVISAGSMSKIRWSHESQLLNDGNVIVFGGDDGYATNPVYYRTTEIYNRIANAWFPTGSMNRIRSSMSSVILNDGRVMAIGGEDTLGIATNTCEWYNPSTGVWTYAPSMNYARIYHEAIRLNNGQVFVAGMNGPSELFDPLTNKWYVTAAPYFNHGRGMSMILLSDGRVFVSGGVNAEKNAEIYDPTTGLWTKIPTNMNGTRKFHSAVLLNNGNVLIWGSTAFSDQNTSERFLVSGTSGFFSSTGLLNSYRAASPGLLLDNGKVIAFGLGDLSNASNTKVIETYDPATYQWTYKTYNFIGSQDYTFNKLHTGELLVSGGMTSTGGGANSGCLLINPEENVTCTKPDRTLAVSASASSLCRGKDVSVTVTGSESGVTYQCLINSTKVGAPVNGGGTIGLTVPSNFLAAGNNIIHVLAYKSTCNGVVLLNSVTITVTQDNTVKPDVTAGGATTFCSGGNVTITSSPVANGYVWNSGESSDSISVTKSGIYFIYLKDANGCFSYPSDTIAVTVFPTVATISAGADKLACTNLGTVQLVGTPASGGTWSGTGVTSSGLFDPVVAGNGSYLLTYSYCGKKDTMKMDVNSLPVIPDFTVKPNKKHACPQSNCSVTVTNTVSGTSYQLFVNGTTYAPINGGSTISWPLNAQALPAYIKVVASVNNTCGIGTKEKLDTINLAPNPNITLSLASDTVCFGVKPSVKIFNSEPGIRYILFDYNTNYQPISDTMTGTGGTLIIPIYQPTYNIKVIVKAISFYGCTLWLNASVATRSRQVNVDFSTSTMGGFIGDVFSFNNSSNADSYIWDIDGTSSTKLTPDPVTFNSTGVKTISVIGNTRIAGCSDTMSHTIEIVSLATLSSGTACQFDTLEKTVDPHRDVRAFHVDKDGNSYLSSSYYSYYCGGDYSGSSGLSLRKFDPNGKMLWSKNHSCVQNSSSQSKFYSNYAVDIETDNVGNIYIAGSFCGNSLQWDALNIAYPNTQNTAYIMKLNSMGVVQWIIKSDYPTKSTAGFTDLIYVDDNNIYASAYFPMKLVFTDGTVKDFYGSQIVIVKIDKDGKLIKSFATENQLNVTGLYSQYSPPDASSWVLGRIASLSPKIALTSTGKILVSGKCNNMIQFGALTFATSGNCTGFIAQLDMVNGWEKVFPTYSYFIEDYEWKIPPVQPFAIDANNDIYTSEYFKPLPYSNQKYKKYPITINGNTMINVSEGNFLTKYDLNGNLKWVNSNSLLYSKSLACLDNELLMYGDYTDFYIMNSQTTARTGIRSRGQSDVLLASYSFNGDMNWMETIGSDTTDNAYLMTKARCSSNSVYFSGITNKKTYYKTATKNLVKNISFIAKYSPGASCAPGSCPDCNGTNNGIAFIDNCGQCVGGTTGLNPCISTTLTENNATEVSIYPNPTTGTILIQAEKSIESVSVVNIIGSEVYSSTESSNSGEIKIDLSQLTPAVYYLKVKTKQGESFNKILLMK